MNVGVDLMYSILTSLRFIKDIAPFFDRMSLAEVSEKTLVDMFKKAIKTTYTSHGNKPGLIAVSGLNYTVSPKKAELTAKLKELKDSQKSPEDKIKELEAELSAIDETETF